MGDIETDSEYSTAATTTYIPGATYSLHTAPGTGTNCIIYQVYLSDSRFIAWGLDPDLWMSFGIGYNDCETVAGRMGASMDDFHSWNPSLNMSNCSLQPGYSDCVLTSWDGM